jgi:ubiquinone/menaquinone biosynthesis C-methylase UbiE
MDFKFPIPPGFHGEPVWIGNGFLIGSEKVPVLRYNQCDAGWDVRLTEFHEEEVKEGNHYIDRASRLHARMELKKYLPGEEGVVLEIGSSSGYLLREIKRAFPDVFLIGSDCIPESLERLAKKVPNVPLIQFDLIDCPLPDNCIDVVIALNVLEHIENDQAALVQMYRILKPGGHAIIEVPANPELYDFYDEQLKHFRRYDLRDIMSMAKRSNFVCLEASHLGFFIYPAFKFMKLRNKQKSMRNGFKKRASMRDLVHLGGPVLNKIVYHVMLAELKLGKIIHYPAGIRGLLILGKK